MTEPMTPAMPMCDECHRPLGLFYAECLICLGHADLHETYYHQWCKWQEVQAATPTPATTEENPDD